MKSITLGNMSQDKYDRVKGITKKQAVLDIGKLISLQVRGLQIAPSSFQKVFDIIASVIRPELVGSKLVPSDSQSYWYYQVLHVGCRIKAGCDGQQAPLIMMQSDAITKGQQSIMNQIAQVLCATCQTARLLQT